MKQVRIILMVAVSTVIFGCHQSAKKTAAITKYKARVFQSELKEFGYDIYKDSVIIIHQPIIPGVPGNKGFATGVEAEKVANLIVTKLTQGISPPSVSLKELDSLQINVR